MLNAIQFKYAKKFLSETYRFTKKYRTFKPLRNLKWFRAWLKSNTKGEYALLDRIPWITFPSISFLNDYLKEEMKVFEYGTGGSTLFFLDRGASVTSVEHDADWAAKVSQEIDSNSTDWNLLLVNPDLEVNFSDKSFENPHDYISSDRKYLNMSFRKYVSTIDSYPDSFFDLILIDGRARASCIIHSIKKVKIGGIIVLDNSDRVRYSPAIKIMEGDEFDSFDFPGASPYVNFFTRTSAWIKM